MGSGAKTAHAPASVTPAGTLAAVAASEADTVAAAGEAFAQVVAGVGEVDSYDDLAQATSTALEAQAALVAEGWPPQLGAEALKGLKAQTSDFLGHLSGGELQELAAAQGFEHPGLVGWNTPPGGQHPLVHWLDPAYPPESPSKLAIQAKAAERYAALAAGGTLNGLTLADVAAQEAALTQTVPAPAAPGAWQATPAEVLGAMTAFNETLVKAPPMATTDVQLAGLIEAENHLAAAVCSEIPVADLDAAKAAAKANVDQRLASANWAARHEAAAALVAKASAAGTVDATSAVYLSDADRLALVRSSTPANERAGLASLAAQRAGQVAELTSLHAGASGHGVAGLDPAATTPAQLAAWAKGTGAYVTSAHQVGEWASSTVAAGDLVPLTGFPGQVDLKAGELTTAFRTWAKSQGLDGLRGAASALGMEPKGATRAQLQNYIAATWDSSLSKAQIQAAVTAKLSPVSPPSAPALAPPPQAKPASPGSLQTGAGSAGGRAPAGSFAAKQQNIVAALKAHQAVAADLPPRPSPSDVAGWSFGPGQSAALGGAHAKTLHAAPDGSMWLFKSDNTGGARAAAEAAASQIYQRVGVPSVGVYERAMGAKVGSVQPLVAGASNLSPNPTTWSQADVDAMVRLHVAAWGVGDHDANHTNVLRTPSGGLLPVDGGQAFKFFGSDRLDIGYHPNGSFGAAPPVFHQAYKAVAAGGLAPGVTVRPEAALPAIKAFEAVPDAQYRAMLAGVATKGVAAGAHWVPAMRSAAGKRLGRAPTHGEVAEEFLHHAVERKHGLRAAFASFFAGLGLPGAAKLRKVA